MGIQGGARGATQLTSRTVPRQSMPPLVAHRVLQHGYFFTSSGRITCHSGGGCVGSYLLLRRALHMRAFSRNLQVETLGEHQNSKIAGWARCTSQVEQKTFAGGPMSPNTCHPTGP